MFASNSKEIYILGPTKTLCWHRTAALAGAGVLLGRAWADAGPLRLKRPFNPKERNRMRLHTFMLLLSLSIVAPIAADAQADKAAIVEFCQSVKGKEYFLKVGVVRIKHLIGGEDATNILPGPEVSYRATFGSVQDIQASVAEDFAEEARLVANREATEDFASTVRHYARGTQVKIEKFKVEKSEIEFNIKEKGGSKTKIRFKFGKSPDDYNLATVQDMFAFTFAETKEDLKEKAVELSLGMSVAEVIKAKGRPISRINLGAKTMLTYGDVKLIFQDDKLSDAQ